MEFKYKYNIDKQLFFDVFKNDLEAYRKMRERFIIVNKKSVFDEYLKIDDLEK